MTKVNEAKMREELKRIIAQGGEAGAKAKRELERLEKQGKAVEGFIKRQARAIGDFLGGVDYKTVLAVEVVIVLVILAETGVIEYLLG